MRDIAQAVQNHPHRNMTCSPAHLLMKLANSLPLQLLQLMLELCLCASGEDCGFRFLQSTHDMRTKKSPINTSTRLQHHTSFQAHSQECMQKCIWQQDHCTQSTDHISILQPMPSLHDRKE